MWVLIELNWNTSEHTAAQVLSCEDHSTLQQYSVKMEMILTHRQGWINITRPGGRRIAFGPPPTL